MSKYYNIPTQVVFTFHNGYAHERQAGIAYRDEIICAECGGLFDMTDEDLEIEIEKEISWVPLEDQIDTSAQYGEIEEEEE